MSSVLSSSSLETYEHVCSGANRCKYTLALGSITKRSLHVGSPSEDDEEDDEDDVKMLDSLVSESMELVCELNRENELEPVRSNGCALECDTSSL